MSQVIILLLFPIGLYFYLFVERKARPAYDKIFTDFEVKTRSDHTLSNIDRIDRYREMLRKNDYTIRESNHDHVIGEKRIFSASLFAMGVGFYYIGALIYLLYFFYFQKPHRVVFHTKEITIRQPK